MTHGSAGFKLEMRAVLPPQEDSFMAPAASGFQMYEEADYTVGPKKIHLYHLGQDRRLLSCQIMSWTGETQVSKKPLEPYESRNKGRRSGGEPQGTLNVSKMLSNEQE
jgi:hypothetical protein